MSGLFKSLKCIDKYSSRMTRNIIIKQNISLYSTMMDQQKISNENTNDLEKILNRECESLYENDIWKGGNKSVKDIDSDVYNILKNEQNRQMGGLELIASENFTSKAVMEVVGSCFTNKYSEGYPGQRYYGGNKYIDELELLTIERALKVFNLDTNEWGCNVQSYSGSTANLNVFGLFLNPGDRFMGLYLPDGGHLSHGFYSPKKAINQSARYFTSLPYYVDTNTGYIDYNDLAIQAKRFCPKLIIAGGSAYPRDWNYDIFRKICNDVGAKLLVDMAHYSGLIASGIMNNPFKYADAVMSTTHKSLRGTRGAILFGKKEYMDELNNCVFPLSQGGPHNHAIAGICVALKEAMSKDFREYGKKTVNNSKELAKSLMELDQKIVTNGTDTHIVLWDLRPQNIGGNKVEYACELAHITVNKNSIHGDKSALNPGGIRLGTPALTTRGFNENNMKDVAKFLVECVNISKEIEQEFINNDSNGKKPKLSEFKNIAKDNIKLKDLGKRVNEYASKFPLPGNIYE